MPSDRTISLLWRRLLRPDILDSLTQWQMPIGKAERCKGREQRIANLFEEDQLQTALDLLELTEPAWHDRYEELTPSEEVIDEILIVSQGIFDGLITAARLAVIDSRDLRIAAEEWRSRR